MLLKVPSYANARVFHAFDRQSTAGIEGLRKYLVQELRDLIGIHRRSRHA
jgi:hypothetical protein